MGFSSSAWLLSLFAARSAALCYLGLMPSITGHEQEPRASWEDKASFTLPILALRCCSGWFDCSKVCGHSKHGCRHYSFFFLNENNLIFHTPVLAIGATILKNTCRPI
jgi:energy-converting hydrogenase Eha subunit A